MGDEREQLISILRRLLDAPKDPSVKEELYRVLTSSTRSSCAIYPFINHNRSHPCMDSCPLCQTLKYPERGWVRCPASLNQDYRSWWQETQTEAEIMQKCVEAIALLESIE